MTDLINKMLPMLLLSRYEEFVKAPNPKIFKVYYIFYEYWDDRRIKREERIRVVADSEKEAFNYLQNIKAYYRIFKTNCIEETYAKWEIEKIQDVLDIHNAYTAPYERKNFDLERVTNSIKTHLLENIQEFIKA